MRGQGVSGQKPIRVSLSKPRLTEVYNLVCEINVGRSKRRFYRFIYFLCFSPFVRGVRFADEYVRSRSPSTIIIVSTIFELPPKIETAFAQIIGQLPSTTRQRSYARRGIVLCEICARKIYFCVALGEYAWVGRDEIRIYRKGKTPGNVLIRSHPGTRTRVCVKCRLRRVCNSTIVHDRREIKFF